MTDVLSAVAGTWSIVPAMPDSMETVSIARLVQSATIMPMLFKLVLVQVLWIL